MERERFNRHYLNLEQNNRANELIDGLIVNFETEYQEVYSGAKNKTVLYAGGHYVNDPRKLILVRKPEILLVESSKLFNYFKEIYKDDVIGDITTQVITKTPEPETLFLCEFIKTNRNKELEQLKVFQSYFNLRLAKDGSKIVMTIDQYQMPDTADMSIPASDVILLRRFDNGYPKNINIRTKTAYGISPRSLGAQFTEIK